MLRLRWVLAGILLAVPNAGGKATEHSPTGNDEEITVPGERPFDAVNIFGDLGKSFQLPDNHENKLWWERMVRGGVGRDRFLILCALRDGHWRNLGDIRDYVEFQMRESYTWKKLHSMLVLMAGRPNFWYVNRSTKTFKTGEGWLEKNQQADFGGLGSQWRIAPSVLPLLYFLLMGCPTDDRCR